MSSSSVIYRNLTADSPIQLCRDRCYPTKYVTNLPRPCLLADGSRLDVDYCHTDELPQCFPMIRDAAARGDNVGIDQMTEEESLIFLYRFSEVFVVRDWKTGLVKAFMIIYPSQYSRTFDNSLAGIELVCSSELSSQPAVYQQLLRLAVDFTQLLDVGYTNCVVCMASSCHQKTSVLRQEGFLIVATIPDSVNIVGRGYIEDFIMVKNLSTTRPRRTTEQVFEMLEKLLPTEQCNSDYAAAELVTANFLPWKYSFANGTTAIIRNMRKDEDVTIYAMFMGEANKGSGYGIHEYPTLAIFRRLVLMKELCVVYEDTTTHEIIAFSLFSDSWYSRNEAGHHAESSTLVNEKFQGVGIGKDVIPIEMILAKELGYAAVLNDYLLSNHRLMHLTKKSVTIVGTIPHGSYTEGWGWDDQIIVYMSLSSSAYTESTRLVESALQKTIHDPTLSKL